MNEITTKRALTDISGKLKALTVTVAALEGIVTQGMSGHQYQENRRQFEIANQEVFDKLEALIDSIPDA